MLLGEHLHTLDDKKRLSLPSKFRKEIGKNVVITRGLDKCLFVYSLAEWEKFTQSLTNLSVGQSDSRAFVRFMLGGAVESSLDASGRILVPDFLKEFAGLEGKVIVAGMYNRIELWNEDSWKAYTGDVENQADALAEKLGEVGMI